MKKTKYEAYIISIKSHYYISPLIIEVNRKVYNYRTEPEPNH